MQSEETRANTSARAHASLLFWDRREIRDTRSFFEERDASTHPHRQRAGGEGWHASTTYLLMFLLFVAMASANFFPDAASVAAATLPPAAPAATSSKSFTASELNDIFLAAKNISATHIEVNKGLNTTSCKVWLATTPTGPAPAAAAEPATKAPAAPQKAAVTQGADMPAATSPRRSNTSRSPSSKSHSDKRLRARRAEMERKVHAAERVARYAEVALQDHEDGDEDDADLGSQLQRAVDEAWRRFLGAKAEAERSGIVFPEESDARLLDGTPLGDVANAFHQRYALGTKRVGDAGSAGAPGAAPPLASAPEEAARRRLARGPGRT